MADHRIRLTDREIELANAAAGAMMVALMPLSVEMAREYGSLTTRLTHVKPGGMPLSVRRARKHFRGEASGT